jgi:hypothetical protein
MREDVPGLVGLVDDLAWMEEVSVEEGHTRAGGRGRDGGVDEDEVEGGERVRSELGRVEIHGGTNEGGRRPKGIESGGSVVGVGRQAEGVNEGLGVVGGERVDCVFGEGV